MEAARLLVERGSLRAQSEDWGEYHFLSMPSPGDRVAVLREGQTQYLTVLSVHHQPIRAPDAASSEPRADVVAKWTGAG
jgi:phage gp45-like